MKQDINKTEGTYSDSIKSCASCRHFYKEESFPNGDPCKDCLEMSRWYPHIEKLELDDKRITASECGMDYIETRLQKEQSQDMAKAFDKEVLEDVMLERYPQRKECSEAATDTKFLKCGAYANGNCVAGETCEEDRLYRLQLAKAFDKDYVKLAREKQDKQIIENLMKKAMKMPDSGKRRAFSTGSVRDLRTGKGRYDLVSPWAIKAMATRMEDGMDKYGERNWEKGQPFMSFMDSAMRHMQECLEDYSLGQDHKEDHLAAAMWNIGAAIHTLKMVENGLLPDELDDRPYPNKRAEEETNNEKCAGKGYGGSINTKKSNDNEGC